MEWASQGKWVDSGEIYCPRFHEQNTRAKQKFQSKEIQEEALGIFATYLCRDDVPYSGLLGGDTSSSVYKVDVVSYGSRRKRVVMGFGDGCE